MKKKVQNEVFRGSGNVYADVGLPYADVLKLKSQIAISIIRRQDVLKLTARATAKMAGCDAADIQRIRNADWSKFTVDRLLKYATNMGYKVELKITQPKTS